MSFEEKQIVDFLKPTPRVFFTVREIARKAGSRRQYFENPDWPRPHLILLADHGLVESNPLGHFCLKEAEAKVKRRYWIGPHLKVLTAVQAQQVLRGESLVEAA